MLLLLRKALGERASLGFTTALTAAARTGRCKMIALLLDHGADVNAMARSPVCPPLSSEDIILIHVVGLLFIHDFLWHVRRSAFHYKQPLITIAWRPFVCWCREGV